MRLRNKVVLVTGAGRGIGQAIALAFKREGARVAVADIDPRTAAATARRLGRTALALTLDVADAASVRSAHPPAHHRHRGGAGAVRDPRQRHRPRHRGDGVTGSVYVDGGRLALNGIMPVKKARR